MKSLLTSAFVLITFAAAAQYKVPIDSLAQYTGKSVTVCSEVYGVKTTEKVTYINVGAKYPHAPLTIVIFKKDLEANFKDTPEKLYGNQHICVTGVVKDYKGKMEIVISKPEDIIVGDIAGAE
jgi:DNA/RNA endonuclease YhcR with UshA esterase domain